jgi:hypothetical protein
MLKLIIHPSRVLLNFVLSLCLTLSKPQRWHVLRTVEALIVSDEEKTLSGLYRQWVKAPDVSALFRFLSSQSLVWRRDGTSSIQVRARRFDPASRGSRHFPGDLRQY